MADNTERVGIELYLDLTTYDRQIAGVIADAGKVEGAWKQALGNIGGDLSFNVDVNMGSLGTVQRTLDDLAKANPNIKIIADDRELNAALGIVEDIDAAAPEVTVNASDAELDTAKRKVDDLDGETASVKVDADSSGAETELESIQSQLENLKQLAVIDLIMNVSGPALGILQQALALVTSTDEAVRTLVARTGQDIPGAAQIIDDLYTANWGESKQQIAEVLALSAQLGIEQGDLAAATESAFQVASVTAEMDKGTKRAGEDVNEILRTQNSLVKNGLAPNYQAAADLITTGFQTGANRGNDLLDTFNEYASTFRELGLDGAQSLGIINSGLAAGFDNSDRVADVLRELSIRVTDLGDTAAQEALGTLGLPSPAEGEALGADFLNQVLTGIKNAAPEDQTLLTRSLFGTLSEDFGLQTILGLDNVDPINATFDTIDGRTQTAADIINDTLGGAINTLFRNVQVEAENFLSSEQINLPQKIDDIKNGITSTIEALKSGQGLAESLEIGLQIPGFADSVHRFEASIGEFAIGVLELIAGVQDFLGRDSSGTRQEIGRLAESQLAYNLKVANPDEIAGEINRAVARGVDTEGLQTAIGTSIGELIASGDLEQAQTLIDQIGDSSIRAADGLDDYGQSLANDALNLIKTVSDPARIEQIIAPYRDAGILQGTTLFDATQFQDEIDTAQITQTFDNAFAQIQEAANEPLLNNILGNIVNQQDVTETTSIFDQFKNAASQTMGIDVPSSVDTAASAVEDADTRIANAMTGNTMTTSFQTVGQVADSVMGGMVSVVGKSISGMVAAEVQFTNQTNILKGALLGLLGQVGPGLLDLALNLQNIAAGASVAAQTLTAASNAGAAGAAGTKIAENATGGVFSGLSVVGETGPEIISSDTNLAVLNNRSTSAIFDAVRSAAYNINVVGAGSGGGGGGNTFNFYTQSDAQSVLISREVGRILRGQ